MLQLQQQDTGRPSPTLSIGFLANVFEPQNVKMVRFVHGGRGHFWKKATAKAYRVCTHTSNMTISTGNAKKTGFTHSLTRFSNHGGGVK